MKYMLMIFASAFFLTGCLKTRNEVRETEQRQVLQQQVVGFQKSSADTGSRFADLEEELRNLNGRVEVIENRVGKADSGVENAVKSSQQQNLETSRKIMALQEALTKMERDMIALNAELQAVKAEKSSSQADKAAAQAKRETFEVAQVFFEKKDWKQAIVNYQRYRDENPKGKRFADATYKIGVSFQELGMKDEAKTFYDEVLNKYPNSDEARRAKLRLKGMKK